MKYSTYENGGNLEGSVTTPGGEMTGPLLLSGKVEASMDAVHKQYVDNAVQNLNADSILTGIISKDRMPALTGDATSVAGNTVTVLAATGVVSGDYAKLTVNAKGLTTFGDSLVEADIPNFDFSKIGLNKPTTLTGYGITDAVSGLNGTVTGNLTLVSDPVDTNDLATKAYVDASVGSKQKIVVGDIIPRTVATSPVGFLRCNGAELSKTTYAALYAVIGDTYSFVNTPGSGKPWQQQYSINSQQNSDITGWSLSTPLYTNIGLSQAIVTKNRVYMLGGNINSVNSANVYTAPINSDGTLGAWTVGTSLPGVMIYSQAVITKNRVYMLGGYNAASNAIATVYTASINSDGTLGAWTVGTSLPVTISNSQAIVTKNRVYLLGGFINGSVSSIVYTAPINSDGTLGTWTTSSSLPVAVYHSQPPLVTKNRVYMLGGYNAASNAIATVYTASINSDGTLGAWTVGTSLPGVVSDSQIVVTKNRAYILGGQSSSIVYTAPINADGTLGTWTTGTSLPATIAYSQVIVTKNRIYTLGANYNSPVYTATISGGLNDYSPYYDGTMTPTDPNNFRLPDFTSKENTSLYYHIKA